MIRPKPPHRHYGTLLLRTALCALAVDMLLFSPENWSFMPLFLAAMTVQCCAAFLTFAHARSPLCEKCAQALPLNASQQAHNRQRPALRLHHYLIGGKRFPRMIWLAFLPLLAQFTYFLSGFTPLGLFWLALTAVLDWAPSRHRLLAPWCPYCRHGGGGGEEPAPIPTPGGGAFHPQPTT